MSSTSVRRRKHARRRSLLHSLLALSAAGAMVTAGVVATATQPATATEPAVTLASLKEAAAAHGKYFGTAVAEQFLGEYDYVTTLNREFNSVTHENSLKWESVQPQPGQFNWSNADRIFEHARSQGMEVRGHTLVWHSQLAGWVNASNARQAMADHIAAVAGRYAGQVASWDVVNEAFEEDGSRRNSPFQQAMGDDFIAEAFRLADAADPNAKLCYNDYNLENPGPKQDAAYNLVRDLKAQGVPIDCIGFQAHFNSGNPMPNNFHETLQRFADLGVDVQITELDIAGSGSSQAEQFRGVVQACLAVSRCNGITVWGVTDKYSWRSSDTPLLFDGNYQPKEAYYAVLDAFGASLTDARIHAAGHRDTAALRPEDLGVEPLHSAHSRVADTLAHASASA